MKRLQICFLSSIFLSLLLFESCKLFGSGHSEANNRHLLLRVVERHEHTHLSNPLLCDTRMCIASHHIALHVCSATLDGIGAAADEQRCLRDPFIPNKQKSKRRSKRSLPSCNPKPDPLKEIPRHLLRPDLSVKRGLASPEIGLGSLDELGLLVQFPEEEEAEVDWDDDVSAKKEKG